MTGVIQDVRYALRQLGRNPGFAAVAVTTLALGIGANTAIFSVVYGILLRPLPYPHSERVVQLCESYQREKYDKNLTYADFRFVQEHAAAFSSLAASTHVGLNLAAGDTAEHINGLHVSANYFGVLGIKPILGRTFSPEEDSGDGERVVLLSAGLWKRLGSDPKVLGGTVLLDGVGYAVLGVMASNMEPFTAGATDVWAPLALVRRTAGSGQNLAVLGRLRDGASLDQARSQIGGLSDSFRQALPGDLGPDSLLDFEPYQTSLSSGYRNILLVLFGAVGFVLLIACANIANLLLGRAVGRSREIAIRWALGGTRARLFRQLITESMLLSVSGSLAGVGLASWGLRTILTFSPADLPRTQDIRLDLQALAFALGLALLTGFVFGLAPALRAAKHNVSATFQEAGARMSSGKRAAVFRNALVVTEIALALVLLNGATLLAETFWRVLRTDAGFNPSRVLAMQVWLNGSKYDSTETVAKYYDDVTQRLQQLPGVQSAAVVGAGLPLEGGGNLPVEIRGKPGASCDFRMVTPEYFHTIGIPLKLGRVFESGDNQHGAAVAVVNESFARRLFPNENVLGKRLKAEQSDSPREIVGVVGDVKSYLEQPAEPTVFIPIAQSPYGISKIFEGWFATSVVLRTAIDPAQVSRSVQVQLHAIDPSVATGNIRTMQQVRSAAVATRQFNMVLLGVFAALAALLAAVGIYGVIAYNVKQKTHEIGVRMALGAQRRHVLGMIYREAVYLAATGIGLGSVGALALARLIQGYLYGVKPTDPAAFMSSAVLLGGVAMLACSIPALRATRVDPLVALRYE